MRVDVFDFDLPPGRIAQRPARPRDAARLLVVGRTGLEDRPIADLPSLVAPGDVMVVNDTRVIPARLVGRRGTARVEITLVKDLDGRRWQALARPARRLAIGDRIYFAPGFAATIAGRGEGGQVTVAFDRAGTDLASVLESHGAMPLPPYIKRPGLADERDRGDYQTVFARRPGAVAAPTAGLHFTPALLAALDARGVARHSLTLHVGAGTFLPVRSERVEDHRLEPERGDLPEATAAAVNAAHAAGRRIVAVGSTSLRLLEAATGSDGRVHPFAGETALFITPGYRFRVVDRLLTNFHLPRSTLFMLVCAFGGIERMKAAYEHAITAGYRFYSYGDACLIDRDAGP